MKRVIVLSSIILIAVGLIWIQRNEIAKLRIDLEIETQNKYALLGECREYEIKRDIIANECDILQLILTDVQKHKSALAEDVRILTNKLKRVESISHTQFEVNTEVLAPIVIRDSMRYIQYSDNYTTLDGLLIDNEFRGKIGYRDTLIQAIEPHYKVDWWIFRWGLQGVHQKAMFKNPNARITFQEYIRIKKKR